MTIARYNSISQKSTLLFGAVPDPYNLEICPDYQTFPIVHTALLHCNHEDRYKRLQDRGSVWTDENILLTIEEAEQQYNEAKKKKMPIINTSLYTVEEVAEGLYYWVENILQNHGGR